MKPAVGLFAKPAVPGQVKTRLIPPLTPPQAATLYAAFLADVATTLATGNAWDWVVFSTDPQAQRATWPDPAPRPSAWYRQEGPDLGARMDHALTRLLEEGRPAALLVGSDHPTLDPAILTRGVVSLEQAEVVLGPSTDGGYYLVGTTRPQPELFRDMPWSSPEVLGRTLSRIRGLGLRLADLPLVRRGHARGSPLPAQPPPRPGPFRARDAGRGEPQGPGDDPGPTPGLNG